MEMSSGDTQAPPQREGVRFDFLSFSRFHIIPKQLLSLLFLYTFTQSSCLEMHLPLAYKCDLDLFDDLVITEVLVVWRFMSTLWVTCSLFWLARAPASWLMPTSAKGNHLVCCHSRSYHHHFLQTTRKQQRPLRLEDSMPRTSSLLLFLWCYILCIVN